jgi:hypothetical protein
MPILCVSAGFDLDPLPALRGGRGSSFDAKSADVAFAAVDPKTEG